MFKSPSLRFLGILCFLVSPLLAMQETSTVTITGFKGTSYTMRITSQTTILDVKNHINNADNISAAQIALHAVSPVWWTFNLLEKQSPVLIDNNNVMLTLRQYKATSLRLRLLLSPSSDTVNKL
jgi:hypothetical protein